MASVRRILGLSFILLAVCALPAAADQATLHIGTGAGTPCATGCGGDPNVISPLRLSIYQNANGAPDLLTPLLLILGIPNTSGLANAPTITSIQVHQDYPPSDPTPPAVTWALGNATPLYGWSGAGFSGSFLPTSPQMYEFLGLEPPQSNASNNVTNWFGVAPPGTTSFGIYVFTINARLGSHDLLDVTFGGTGLASGSMAIAYGCDRLSRGDCPNGGTAYSTPFTESGNARGVPEPSSLILVTTGLVALGGARWRRKKN